MLIAFTASAYVPAEFPVGVQVLAALQELMSRFGELDVHEYEVHEAPLHVPDALKDSGVACPASITWETGAIVTVGVETAGLKVNAGITPLGGRSLVRIQ